MTQQTNIKTYTEMKSLKTFEERFRYLQQNGKVGESTFGFDRYLNQLFYKSRKWKAIRDKVIIRDNACDLGDPDRPISGRIIVHHMNAVNVSDILNETEFLIDPEYLVCVSHNTHEAITYGDETKLEKNYVPRTKNDTAPWKRG